MSAAPPRPAPGTETDVRSGGDGETGRGGADRVKGPAGLAGGRLLVERSGFMVVAAVQF